VYYEHVPFHCTKCHEHRNLFKYFPKNKLDTDQKHAEDEDEDDFRKVTNRRRQNHKSHSTGKYFIPPMNNSFEVLATHSEEVEETPVEDQPTPKRQHQESKQDQGGGSTQDPSINGSKYHSAPGASNAQDLMLGSSNQDLDVLMDEDMSDLALGDMDLLGLEDACRHNAFHAISPKHIQLLKDALIKAKE
jgi:hypothetical protein